MLLAKHAQGGLQCGDGGRELVVFVAQLGAGLREQVGPLGFVTAVEQVPQVLKCVE